MRTGSTAALAAAATAMLAGTALFWTVARSKVTVTEDDEDGEYELSIEPHDPGTDAAVKRMARDFTPEVMHSRTTACLEDDEE